MPNRGNNMTLKEISDITKLSIEEIDKLKNAIDK